MIKDEKISEKNSKSDLKEKEKDKNIISLKDQIKDQNSHRIYIAL